MNADTIRAIIAAESASFYEGRENDPTYNPQAKVTVLNAAPEVIVEEVGIEAEEVVAVEVAPEPAKQEPVATKTRKSRK